MSPTFRPLPNLQGVQVKDISCWNMSACIDKDRTLYLWGSIFSTKESHCIQIDEPEIMHDVKLSKIEIGQSIIAGIDQASRSLQIITCNDNSLESTASFTQFQFKPMEDIKDKPIELFSIGKSGYLVAIGQLQNGDGLSNTVKVESQKSSPVKNLSHAHDVSFSIEETKMKEMIRMSDIKSKSFLDDQSRIHTARHNQENSEILKLKDLLDAKEMQLTLKDQESDQAKLNSD